MRNDRTASARQSIVLAVAAVALVALAAVVYLRTRPAPIPSVDEGRPVVEQFLTSIRTGKGGEAWDTTTAEFKSLEGRESFVRSTRKQPLLKEELAFYSAQEVTVQDQPRREYIYQSPKSGTQARVLLGAEGGVWKVDRLTL
ncbi:hypothetical protein Pla175_10870 [Pirellulimonas nuda]|uniref:DUF4878 domain-containing protein n=1 Tax=Pirellulimonas nuda TaxID=2528009 RepID=A0A518D8B1_9BACT|nr:hypothetical protein [Pirellulimonas nuda]QDU87721.1 hypothetical protein Pla175_10870 [Pirellulimonas nuda]